MRRFNLPALVGVLILAAGLGGCASFKAVSEFGDATGTMTGTVRAEFRQLSQLCADEAGLAIVVTGAPDDAALASCLAFDRAQGQLAAVTIGVLDGYARALSALADDRSFSVSPAIRGVGAQLGTLRDATGDAVIDAKDARALAAVAGLLVDLAASAKRQDAVRRMVDATPDLAASGRLLRSFFLATPGVTPAGARPPHQNMVRIIGTSMNAIDASLQSPAMRAAEPIRTAELLRAMRLDRQLLAQRDPALPDAVPVRVAAAIDAWLLALDSFQRNAFKPDAAEWLASLQSLRNQLQTVQDAVDAR